MTARRHLRLVNLRGRIHRPDSNNQLRAQSEVGEIGRTREEVFEVRITAIVNHAKLETLEPLAPVLENHSNQFQVWLVHRTECQGTDLIGCT
jgi:hypothetical protein